MGFADVIASTHDDVPVGTRCFGFYPMSKHLLIEPASASPTSIIDGVAHRQGLAPAYNQYAPVDGDVMYTPATEDEYMLLRGLFTTSFLAEDFLSDSDFFGSKAIVISSASSKTSIAMAYVVSQRGQAKAVGLTSSTHRDFVAGLGLYDQVLTYDEISALDGDTPSVYVDMAGNTKVSREVHEHLGESLKFSQRIGGTHWDAGGDDSDIPGPERKFFFAPGQIQKRLGDWGSRGFQERLGASWAPFRDSASEWLKIERAYGREALERTYRATLQGSARPEDGHVLSLWENADAAAGH
jgi:hypothetical protein